MGAGEFFGYENRTLLLALLITIAFGEVQANKIHTPAIGLPGVTGSPVARNRAVTRTQLSTAIGINAACGIIHVIAITIHGAIVRRVGRIRILAQTRIANLAAWALASIGCAGSTTILQANLPARTVFASANTNIWLVQVTGVLSCANMALPVHGCARVAISNPHQPFTRLGAICTAFVVSTILARKKVAIFVIRTAITAVETTRHAFPGLTIKGWITDLGTRTHRTIARGSLGLASVIKALLSFRTSGIIANNAHNAHARPILIANKRRHAVGVIVAGIAFNPTTTTCTIGRRIAAATTSYCQ